MAITLTMYDLNSLGVKRASQLTNGTNWVFTPLKREPKGVHSNSAVGDFCYYTRFRLASPGSEYHIDEGCEFQCRSTQPPIESAADKISEKQHPNLLFFCTHSVSTPALGACPSI